MSDHREFYRRHLPHWHPSGATFFVTFRLKGSLPRSVIKAARSESSGSLPISLSTPGRLPSERHFPREDRFRQCEAHLDSMNVGPHWLAEPQVARMVAEALEYRHNTQYDLNAFCIMPNHVHAVFRPLEAEGSPAGFGKIMQGLKRHTARRANALIGRAGAFWQDESYDHVVRDAVEFRRIIAYILHNPVRAGLADRWEDWPWSYCKGEYA